MKSLLETIEFAGAEQSFANAEREEDAQCKREALQTRLSALLMFNLTRESDRFKQRRVALNFVKEAKKMGWEPFPCMLEKAQKAISMGTQTKT